MASLDETRRVLEEALKMERTAEVNCDMILKDLNVNGFRHLLEIIRNDEHRHQKMVRQLLGMVSGENLP